jgi:peptide/nickel transport system permease protein
MKRKVAMGIVISVILVFCFAAVFAPLLAPHSPEEQNLCAGLSGPTHGHPFGQDKLGRDVLSRMIYGARVSLIVGVAVVLISALVGFMVGAMAGTFGGIVDQAVMRIIDLLMAFPGILLAIALAAVLGPGLGNVIFALSLLGWVGYARLVRAQVLVERERPYFEAAKALGAAWPRLIFRHLAPNVAGPVLVQASFGIAGAVLAEAALSFLGLGTQKVPSFGSLLSHGINFLRTAPHLTIFPGLAVFALVISFNLLGDFLGDYLRVEEKGRAK